MDPPGIGPATFRLTAGYSTRSAIEALKGKLFLFLIDVEGIENVLVVVWNLVH